MSDTSLPNRPLANGQTLRLPGVARDAALYDQLYRYAEDLQQSIDRCAVLEIQNKDLRDTCAWLEESRRELDELVRGSHDIHFITDTSGMIFQCNAVASTLAPPQRLAGSNLSEWVMPGHLDDFTHIRIEAMKGDVKGDEQELELHLHQGENELGPLIVAVRAFALYRNGVVHSLHWVMRNITYLRENEFDSQISTMVFKGASEGVMITDLEGEILAVNPAFAEITGYSADEAIGRNASFLSSGVQDAAFYFDMWAKLQQKGSWQGELFNRRKSGEMFPQWININAAHNNSGQVLSYVAMFSDVSRLMRAEQRLAYLAHYDTLTNLPNRHLFGDRLAQALEVGKRHLTPFAVMFIDLDCFKQINDTHGHYAGDRVLQEAARRIQGAVRAVDTVARLGGDEFVVIAPGLNGDAAIDVVCQKIIAAISAPILFDDKVLHIGCSLGCAQNPQDGEDETTLLRHADQAMYIAKSAGGSLHMIYQGGSQSVSAKALARE